jgi:5-methyltetrahydropteroyltriglutamate--homocysteine methyltransferase
MERSTRRILTTHTGSLPRPKALTALHVARSRGEAVNPAALAVAVDAATRDAVAHQHAVGIDVGNDGEQGRESFFTYVRERLSGYGGTSQRPPMRDLVHYPTFVERMVTEFSRPMVSLLAAPQAIGPVRHMDGAPIARECEAFLACDAGGFVERFMTAPSPGIVAAAMTNAHYASLEEYVWALADALRPEYEAIVAHGLVLQVDAPDLAMERHTLFADRPLGDFLGFVDVVLAALGRALAGVPRDRVRLHVCWGNYEGPHTFDVPLEEILPRLASAPVGALVLPFANPRHEHEIACLARHALASDVLVVAGVIDTTTNYVEHPELVADRLERVAAALGDATRVLAGTDCGFDTAAGLGGVASEIVWEKLAALRAGADLASRRLLHA